VDFADSATNMIENRKAPAAPGLHLLQAARRFLERILEFLKKNSASHARKRAEMARTCMERETGREGTALATSANRSSICPFT
jgi:hypothetical protein